MLKVALPRPSTDAVTRGEGRAVFVTQLEDGVPGAFEAAIDEPPFKRWTRAEVAELQARQPALSPWKVVLAQVAVGALAALVAWLAIGTTASAASALYGAAVVALPGALMARGATSRLTSISPLFSAVALLGWAAMKIAASVVMLALAARIVVGLNWPVMLVTLGVCLQTYWLALLWPSRAAATAA